MSDESSFLENTLGVLRNGLESVVEENTKLREKYQEVILVNEDLKVLVEAYRAEYKPYKLTSFGFGEYYKAHTAYMSSISSIRNWMEELDIPIEPWGVYHMFLDLNSLSVEPDVYFIYKNYVFPEELVGYFEEVSVDPEPEGEKSE